MQRERERRERERVWPRLAEEQPPHSDHLTVHIKALPRRIIKFNAYSFCSFTMRVNRAKMVRKYLRFFRLVYQISPSYNVLLDGNFIYAALKNNVNIADRLTKMLQGEEFTLYVLQSSLDELRSIGAKGETALTYGLQKCTVLDDTGIPGDTSFNKMVGYLGMYASFY